MGLGKMSTLLLYTNASEACPMYCTLGGRPLFAHGRTDNKSGVIRERWTDVLSSAARDTTAAAVVAKAGAT